MATVSPLSRTGSSPVGGERTVGVSEVFPAGGRRRPAEPDGRSRGSRVRAAPRSSAGRGGKSCRTIPVTRPPPGGPYRSGPSARVPQRTTSAMTSASAVSSRTLCAGRLPRGDDLDRGDHRDTVDLADRDGARHVEPRFGHECPAESVEPVGFDPHRACGTAVPRSSGASSEASSSPGTGATQTIEPVSCTRYDTVCARDGGVRPGGWAGMCRHEPSASNCHP